MYLTSRVHALAGQKRKTGKEDYDCNPVSVYVSNHEKVPFCSVDRRREAVQEIQNSNDDKCHGSSSTREHSADITVKVKQR